MIPQEIMRNSKKIVYSAAQHIPSGLQSEFEF